MPVCFLRNPGDGRAEPGVDLTPRLGHGFGLLEHSLMP
jgi:hypothetical protein